MRAQISRFAMERQLSWVAISPLVNTSDTQRTTMHTSEQTGTNGFRDRGRRRARRSRSQRPDARTTAGQGNCASRQDLIGCLGNCAALSVE